jgi:hypothetical protein
MHEFSGDQPTPGDAASSRVRSAADPDTDLGADLGARATGEEGVNDAAVLEALRELGVLDNLPVHEHADVLERVNQALNDRLAEPE